MQDPFLVRLPWGKDLLEAMTEVFVERAIPKATFNVIGALRGCVLGYYDSRTRHYNRREFPEHVEIVSCMGNVSEKDGNVFVHAHVVIAGPDFVCYGGHLMPGSRIFAAEMYVMPLPGPVPVRTYDESTGLALWGSERDQGNGQ